MREVYSLTRVEGSETPDSPDQLLADCAGFDARAI